jgi:hypothetical protein
MTWVVAAEREARMIGGLELNRIDWPDEFEGAAVKQPVGKHDGELFRAVRAHQAPPHRNIACRAWRRHHKAEAPA